jgi:hypothetical protein
MVRTSDFQFENAGSSPANPNLLLNQQPPHYVKSDNFIPHLSFHFLFVSLIAPFISPNISLLFRKTGFGTRNLLKSSYVILAWFYYMNSLQRNESKTGVRFFVLPTRAQVYTLTKAPIAHKLWSKEQYKFTFYLLRVSFTNCSFVESELRSVNQGLLFMLLAVKSLPFFSSNLLTLKNSTVKIGFYDLDFFSFRS